MSELSVSDLIKVLTLAGNTAPVPPPKQEDRQEIPHPVPSPSASDNSDVSSASNASNAYARFVERHESALQRIQKKD